MGCKPVKTLIEQNNKLGGSKEELMVARGAYQRLEGKLFCFFFFLIGKGKLFYLSHTRPNIAYAIGVVSRFMQNPYKSHLEVAYHIIRCLKGTFSVRILSRK